MGDSRFLQVLVVLCACAISFQATIGDGRVSLYTGRPVNHSSRRGSCYVDGRYYPSETAIPRDHPCHYCICYQSQVTCYWKQCAAAPKDCAILHFENTCNPSLYMCKIPTKAKAAPEREFGARLNKLRRRRLIREATPTSSLRLPVDEPFPIQFDADFVSRVERSLRVRRAVNGSHHHHHHDPNDKSCMILGVKYNLGEVIGVASDVCMECRCAAGNMYCSPKCCFLPSPFTLTSQHHQEFSTRPQEAPSPHPLSYVRNQYTEGTFL
ncbi:uncharacterized protein LOC122260793 [Penaeus japonicus]|uniref:uncharacterized protein LOC122260793 n=1 Tax=Penaeus japonicus TaxID=27405 RepID=UPI001C710872|nr:uncharacterized protein LOC122260793 [Penaeus japonicus]